MVLEKRNDDVCKMWRNITRNNCVRIFLHKIHVSGHVASFLFAPLQIRSLAQNCDENYTTNDIRTLLQFDVLIIMISVYSSRIRFDIRGQFQHKRDVVHMNHRHRQHKKVIRIIQKVLRKVLFQYNVYLRIVIQNINVVYIG